jgi:hypothetical protein
VYPSNIGSWEVAKPSIWNQWSIRVKVEQPPSSAERAVAARAGANDSGRPGRVKLMKWIPSFMIVQPRVPDREAEGDAR